MNSHKHILAIDLGTSDCKCADISLEGKVTHWAFEPVDLKIIGHNGAEQNPEDWWHRWFQERGHGGRNPDGHPRCPAPQATTQSWRRSAHRQHNTPGVPATA